MLTAGSNVFFCNLEIAREVAEDYANLRKLRGALSASFEGWEDRATGGGGCRITWHKGIAWVSRHSGYASADITAEVCEFLVALGAEPITGNRAHCLAWQCNPRMWGLSDRTADERRAELGL